ncbi:ABC transporter substrate-binding protein [Roseomonas fluvialis]|uniref:Glutathione ABC transporter substrate-binding protein n=1 Tax=Roseomonas fluvialis TaxID=1750527 RepID=A0ABN6P064_9PROT|nr:ABC transporter substrate-binding protein [Roseomonas fluvialis]BDG71721.1 glutathione ABC transporter substrate-binding protein [Roseomonas fluvialis]
MTDPNTVSDAAGRNSLPPVTRRGVVTVAALSALLAGQTSAQTAGRSTGAALRLALSAGLDRLDPHKTGNGTDHVVLGGIYETLFWRVLATGEMQPRLATGYRLVNSKLWEFTLRQGVRFHDGTPFTADDVKFSIERAKEGGSHAIALGNVERVEVVDPFLVRVHTSAPDPTFLLRMQPLGGAGRVHILSKVYSESRSAQDVNDNPMGTGPYRMTRWLKGRSVALTRFDDYWGPKPDVANIVITFIPEASTRVNALIRGEVDLIQRLPLHEVDRIGRMPNLNVARTRDGLVHTILLNSRQPPFDDLDVRRAFNHAIDIRGIIAGLLGDNGTVLGVPMAPNVVQIDSTLQPYRYDPALARSILSSRPPIELRTFTSDGRYVADREIYQAINAQLEAVGFKVQPQTMEWGRLISMMTTRSAGPFFMIGWDFSEGDASKTASFTLSTGRTSGTNNPAYDLLVLEAEREMDPEKRKEMWKRAQRILYDNYLLGPIWMGASVFGASRRYVFNADLGEFINLAGINSAA